MVPCVVGGASRVQELVIDLLAISRYAQAWTDEPHEAEVGVGTQVAGAMRFALGQANGETGPDCPANVPATAN
jgi:hypothetical protein